MSEEAINAEPLTIVLVHGAFADASSWNGVIERLQAAGMQREGPRESAARDCSRLCLHRQLHRTDSWACPRGRTLVRGCGDLERAPPTPKNVVGLVYVPPSPPKKARLLGDVESGSKDSVLMYRADPLQYPDAPGR